MIIFSNAFLLAEAATATPLTHARIGYQTWLRDLGDVAIIASSETIDGPKDSPIVPDTATYWEPSSMAAPATWVADMGTSRAVDYAGLFGELNGCAVKFETSTNGSDWDDLGSEILPSDDAPLMFLDTSRTCRYIRLTVTGSVAPKIAVVYAGEVLAMERPIYGGHGPLTLSRNTELNSQMSRNGHFLGQSFQSHGVEGVADYKNLSAAWYRSTFDPFVKAARGYPYFWGWRPATFPTEVALVWTRKPFRPSNMGKRDLMQVAWPMEGVGHE